MEIRSLQIQLVKVRSYWNRVDPQSNMIGVLTRRWPCESTDTGRTPGEDEGRDQSYAAVSQGTPVMPVNLQKLGRGQEGFSYRSQRENGPANTSILY